jgi:hypothetical protein
MSHFFLCPCCLAVVESEPLPKSKFVRKTHTPRPPIAEPLEDKSNLDDLDLTLLACRRYSV